MLILIAGLTIIFPSSLDTLYGSAVVLSEKVREMTGGNFDIRVYPGGELVPALEVLDSVQKGSIQAGQSASYYYIGKNRSYCIIVI